MRHALDLYERLRVRIRSHVTNGTPDEAAPSQMSHARAGVESHVISSESISDYARARGSDTRDTSSPPLDYPVCPHVDDIELAYWYAENPKVTCARCWLERQK